MATSCALRTLFSCTILLLVGKNSLYNLSKVLTTVSRKYPLFLFRAIFLTDLEHHDVFKRSQGQVFREVRQPLSRGCAASPFPLQGNPTQCSRGSRGARPGGRARPPPSWRPRVLPGLLLIFFIFLNIPKRRNIALKTILESVYLSYHIPIPFRSLKRSGKCPLCIPPGLQFQ